MLAQATATDDGGLLALSLAIVVALIFLFIIRLMDPNEKEPLWAVGMALGFGFFAGVVFYLLVDTGVLELEIIEGALIEELGRFAIIAAVVATLNGIGRARGWSEVSGLLDGIVYGTAVGLGLTTASVFVTELVFPTSPLLPVSPLGQLWPILLVGLADGIFGGIIGAGFGAATEARSAASRVLYPIVGLSAAFLAHAGYSYVRFGMANTSQGPALKWVALLLPLAVVIGVMIMAIGRERRAIITELEDEANAGVVSENEFRLLRSPAARRSAYAKAYMSGDFDGWGQMKALHNRQVQLALSEARLRREADPDRRAMILAETEAFRASILDLKAQQQGSSSATTTAGV